MSGEKSLFTFKTFKHYFQSKLVWLLFLTEVPTQRHVCFLLQDSRSTKRSPPKVEHNFQGMFFFLPVLLGWLEKKHNIFPKWWFFMVMNPMVESVKTCKNHRLNKQKKHMFFCFRAMLPFTFLTKCISMYDPAYSTEMFVWVTILYLFPKRISEHRFWSLRIVYYRSLPHISQKKKTRLITSNKNPSWTHLYQIKNMEQI